jgi:hypothetical protein
MRRALGLLLAGAALAAAPAAQAATTDYGYAVDFDGRGSYHLLEREEFADGWRELEIDLTLSLTGAMPDPVVFRGSDVYNAVAADGGRGVATGTFVRRDYHREYGLITRTCTTTDDARQTYGTTQLDSTLGDLVPLDGQAHLFLRPFDGWFVGFACSGGTESMSLIEADPGTVAPGEGLFDLSFSLPGEVFGMGFIEQVVAPRTVQGGRCPGYDPAVTQECRLQWGGKVRFRKAFEHTVPDQAPPAPPPSPDLPELVPLVPPPAPPAQDDDWLVPLVASTSASLTSTTASVKVTCPAGCAGTASVLPAGSARAAAAKRRPLASQRFRVKPGRKAATVRVTLGRKARSRLRRSGRATLQLTFTSPKRRTQTIALRRRSASAGRG